MRGDLVRVGAAILLLGAGAILGAFGAVGLLLTLAAWETTGRDLADLVWVGASFVLAYLATVAALRMLRGHRR